MTYLLIFMASILLMVLGIRYMILIACGAAKALVCVITESFKRFFAVVNVFKRLKK